jgi:hypothetical protein
MKLSTIYEALSKQQELDSVRLTYNPDHIDNTSSPHEYEKRGISPKWVKQRNQFLEHHPEAKQMFAKGGEKRELSQSIDRKSRIYIRLFCLQNKD